MRKVPFGESDSAELTRGVFAAAGNDLIWMNLPSPDTSPRRGERCSLQGSLNEDGFSEFRARL